MQKSNPNLFLTDGEAAGAPGLKATRCRACGHVALLWLPICPVCGGRAVDAVCVGGKATLGRFSVVHHGTEGFAAPYVIGEVITDEGPRAFAPIMVAGAAGLVEGDRLDFTLVPDAAAQVVRFAYTRHG